LSITFPPDGFNQLMQSEVSELVSSQRDIFEGKEGTKKQLG